ncbi:MAG: hypothetical protein MK183_06960 [Verrucomicrobiales bacterium]|nr:hypothetical protein [Verrucomicrobiales bacterium]
MGKRLVPPEKQVVIEAPGAAVIEAPGATAIAAPGATAIAALAAPGAPGIEALVVPASPPQAHREPLIYPSNAGRKRLARHWQHPRSTLLGNVDSK